MARTAATAGYRRVIGFDMGGTSTDVSHYAGEFERQYETGVADRMRAPMLSIHTVAAGGGSIRNCSTAAGTGSPGLAADRDRLRTGGAAR
jgi:N-methylhydantoinase A/oxoprolinase/acetone carboxylase beta subunit